MGSPMSYVNNSVSFIHSWVSVAVHSVTSLSRYVSTGLGEPFYKYANFRLSVK